MRGIAGFLVLLLAACSSAPTTAPANFDFGLAPTTDALMLPVGLGIGATQAPAWLDGPSIVYRLAYANPAQLRSYANSRWAGAPAELFTQRLNLRAAQLAPQENKASATTWLLQTQLQEFSQIFDSASSSYVVVQIQASIIDAKSQTVLAQQVFTVQRKAAPDAAGAVLALTLASDATIDAVQGWSRATLSAATSK